MPHRVDRRAIGWLVVCLLLSGLAACDWRTPPATQLIAVARKNALTATSGRVAGTVVDGETTSDIDLAGSADGANQRVTVKGSNGTATLLTVDGRTWMKADEKFWTTQVNQVPAGITADKYVELPAGRTPQKETNLGTLLKRTLAGIQGTSIDNRNTEVSKTDVSSTPVWQLRASTPEQETRIAITRGEPNQLVEVSGPGRSRLVFSEWNSVAAFAAPSAQETFTLGGPQEAAPSAKP